MARHGPATAEAVVWIEVSVQHPCPSCGATDGCAVQEGREFYRCLKTISEWPLIEGGWLHRTPVEAELAGARR